MKRRFHHQHAAGHFFFHTFGTQCRRCDEWLDVDFTMIFLVVLRSQTWGYRWYHLEIMIDLLFWVNNQLVSIGMLWTPRNSYGPTSRMMASVVVTGSDCWRTVNSKSPCWNVQIQYTNTDTCTCIGQCAEVLLKHQEYCENTLMYHMYHMCIYIYRIIQNCHSIFDDDPPDEQLPPSPELDQLRQAVLRAEAEIATTGGFL